MTPRRLLLPHAGSAGARAALLASALAAGCVDLGPPAWSPDGRRIVYMRLAGARPEVRLLDIDSGESPRLIATNAFGATWMPGANRVFYLYLAGAEGGKGLCSCLPDGTDVLTHVPHDIASVAWYTPARGGRSVYYLNEADGGLYALDLDTGRAERLLPADVKCAAAALGASGRLLACAVPRAKGPGFDLRVFDLDDKSWLRQSAELGAPGEGEAAPGPRVLFTPDGREVVAFVRPEKEIVCLPVPRGRARKATVPRAGPALLFACLSPDGNELHLTWATDMEGRSFMSAKVDLAKGKGEVVDEAAPALVGGPSWEPGGGAVAEHTPMGLRVSTRDGRWTSHYPVGPDEHVRLGEHLIAAGDPAAAAALARRAFEGRTPDADVLRLRLLESDASAALGERQRAARILLEGWLLHPISDVPAEEVARRAATLHGEDRLVDVIRRALRGDAASRAKMLVAGLAHAAGPGAIAGLNFRIGEAELESGDAQEAAKRFRLASEAPEFPAADYAAGLAGAAQYVAGRDDYAAELLAKAVDLFPASLLQEDFREALARVQDPSTAKLRGTAVATHPSGLSAWGSITTKRAVRWSLRPVLGPGRRILVETSFESEVKVAGADQRVRTLLRGLRVDLGSLAFSPSGRTLAFVAGGAGGQAACVVDLAGNVLVGDAAALATGEVAGGEAVVSLAWDEAGRALVLQVVGPDGATEERRVDVPEPAAPPEALTAPARGPAPAPAGGPGGG